MLSKDSTKESREGEVERDFLLWLKRSLTMRLRKKELAWISLTHLLEFKVIRKECRKSNKVLNKKYNVMNK